MLGHDHEVKLVSFRGCDQFGKRSVAVTAERRMNVNHSLVINVIVN